MYHVTDSSPEELYAHGIDHRRGSRSQVYDDESHGYYRYGSPPANYFWPTLSAAQVWARDYVEGATIIAVDLSGFTLHRDRFWDNLPADDADYVAFVGPRGGAPRAYYTRQSIPARRLRTLTRAERKALRATRAPLASAA